MPNDKRNLNDEIQITAQASRIRSLWFIIFSAFVTGVASFHSRSPHARHLRKRQEAAENFLTWRVFDLRDTDRLRNIKASGSCAPQRLQMCPAAKSLPDVMNISANIKSLAAENAKIDIGNRDSVDCVAIDVNQARF